VKSLELIKRIKNRDSSMPFKKAATNTDEDNGSNSDTSQMRMTPTVMQEPFHSKKTAIKEKSGGNQWF
jgi:hypothetical protein